MAEDIGRSLLVYGRRIPKAELFARLDAVDASTVLSTAALRPRQYPHSASQDLPRVSTYLLWRRIRPQVSIPPRFGLAFTIHVCLHAPWR